MIRRPETRLSDGETLINDVGLLVLIVKAAYEEKNAPAIRIFNSLCRTLALRGFGGGATKIRLDFERIKDDNAAVLIWINSALDGFITAYDVAKFFNAN